MGSVRMKLCHVCHDQLAGHDTTASCLRVASTYLTEGPHDMIEASLFGGTMH